VFILVALMSAVPTIEFLSWRKAVRAGQAPTVSDKKLKTVRSILHYELIGVVVILAAAALMAKGGWR
jgi:putative membrane protein